MMNMTKNKPQNNLEGRHLSSELWLGMALTFGLGLAWGALLCAVVLAFSASY